jgi:hypothetical protein
MNVRTWRRVAFILFLSVLLAYFSEFFIRQYSPNLLSVLPGKYISDRTVPVPPPPNQLANLGDRLLVTFAVDSLCYFILISGLYALTHSYLQRQKPD